MPFTGGATDLIVFKWSPPKQLRLNPWAMKPKLKHHMQAAILIAEVAGGIIHSVVPGSGCLRIDTNTVTSLGSACFPLNDEGHFITHVSIYSRELS